VFTPEGQGVANSAQAVQALDFFSKLFNQDRVASKSSIAAPTANVGAMAANLVAMQLGNQLTVRDFRDNNPSQAPNLVVADPVEQTQQVTTNWTDWLAISQQTKHADAAWKFISLVAQSDNLLKYNETMYFIPPRKSLRTTGYMADPQLQQFVTIMEKYGRSINTNPAALEVYQTIMQNAVANKAVVDVVDIMAFDYYDHVTTNMGAAAQSAATGAVAQLQNVYPNKTSTQLWAMMGDCPAQGGSRRAGRVRNTSGGAAR